MTATVSAIRVVVVDDQPIIRQALCALLQSLPGVVVAGDSDASGGASLISRLRPDVVLLQLDGLGLGGVETIPNLTGANSGTRVVVLTGQSDPDLHRQAVRLGAAGLVLKGQESEVLSRAIEKVHQGEIWFPRSTAAAVLAEMSRPARERQDPKILALTQREREVISLVGQGLKNKQIAERLFISEATVRNHLTSILGKLELSDRFELCLVCLPPPTRQAACRLTRCGIFVLLSVGLLSHRKCEDALMRRLVRAE
jgi:DNA-binding NarL/FixJ family response regulator